MVILQFNKLIRNKWVWGVFAILVSAAFCFDDMFSSRGNDDSRRGIAGTLAGEEVDEQVFLRAQSDARGIGNSRDDRSTPSQINHKAWKALAGQRTAHDNGIVVGDTRLADAIRRMFGGQAGQFDFNQYRQSLSMNLGVTPEAFEDFLRRRMTVSDGVEQQLVGAAVWASPMETDQAVADMTDVFTVRVATFEQDAAAAAKIKVDDAALKAWYDKNVKSLALPELVKVRTIRYDATDAAVLAKMTVTEDEMRDQYDATVEKYTSTDTNGVEVVKQFEEVKGEIEADLRRIAALDYFETNLSSRAYRNFAKDEDRKASRLDKIAKEDGLTAKESGWFASDGTSHEGFTAYWGSICPGAENFLGAVAELDMENEDFRYQVVRSRNAVWLVEKIAVQPAKTPSFEEAKGKIDARALRDAKADAFKAEVSAVIAKGREAVLAGKNVSTNFTFSAVDLGRDVIPNQIQVVTAAMGLRKGEISEFTSVGSTKAIVVVCEDRVPGDLIAAEGMRDQCRDQVANLAMRHTVEKWGDWNLKRLDYRPNADYSDVEPSEEGEFAE